MLMKQQHKALSFLLMVVALALLAGNSFAQTPLQKCWDPAGSEKLTIKVQPFGGAGAEDAPLYFISFDSCLHRSGILMFGKATKLANRSDKAIRTIQLKLFLYNEQTPAVIQARGDFPASFKFSDQSLPGGLQPGGVATIQTFGEGFMKSLGLFDSLKSGELEGSYRIEVAVTKVEFNDGSVWTLQADAGEQSKTAQ
jgi:hypothetical protein